MQTLYDLLWALFGTALIICVPFIVVYVREHLFKEEIEQWANAQDSEREG